MSDALGRVGNFLDVHLAGRQNIGVDKEKEGTGHVDLSRATVVRNKVTGRLVAYRHPKLSRLIEYVFGEKSIGEEKKDGAPVDRIQNLRENTIQGLREGFRRQCIGLSDEALDRLLPERKGAYGSTNEILFKMSTLRKEINLAAKYSDGAAMLKFKYPHLNISPPPRGVYMFHASDEANSGESGSIEKICRENYEEYYRNNNDKHGYSPTYDEFMTQLSEYKINTEKSRKTLGHFVGEQHVGDFNLYGHYAASNDDVNRVVANWRGATKNSMEMDVSGATLARVVKYELTLLSIEKLTLETEALIRKRPGTDVEPVTPPAAVSSVNIIQWEKNRRETLRRLNLRPGTINDAIRIEKELINSINKSISKIESLNKTIPGAETRELPYDFRWVSEACGVGFSGLAD